MSSQLSASHTLELLTRLKTTVREFLERAAKLESDFQAQAARERQRQEASLQEQSNELTTALASADAELQTSLTAAENRFQNLKTWISRANQAAKEKALNRVENQTGARKYELQKRMLQAERDRDSALANAANASQQFKQSLAAEQEVLAKLERNTQVAFRGYPKFKEAFFKAYETDTGTKTADEKTLLDQMRDSLARVRSELDQFQNFAGLKIFRFLALWVFLALASIPLFLYLGGLNQSSYVRAGGIAAGMLVIVLGLRYVFQRKAKPLAFKIANELGQTRRTHDTAAERAEAHYQEEVALAKKNFESISQTVDSALKQAVAESSASRTTGRQKADERGLRVAARNNQLHELRLRRLRQKHGSRVESLRLQTHQRSQHFIEASDSKARKMAADREQGRQNLEQEWQAQIQPLYDAIQTDQRTARTWFPPWSAELCKEWNPPPQFSHLAKCAELEVDVVKLCEGNPREFGLAMPGPLQFGLPLCLSYPEQGSLLLETAATGRENAIATLNSVILRLLSTAPPGRLRFTIIDPVGLGQNFAGVMHLADYEDQLINSRIWTQSGQIEEKLADLNGYMEKVIQMYLRNEYRTIAEYNEQAGVIAEKYHFLVIADFPANFTDTSAKRLLSIATSGARCGVYTLIHWDRRQPLPADFIPDELRKSSLCIQAKGREFAIPGTPSTGVNLFLDSPPPPELAIEFIHRIGRASRDSSRVEVPFAHVAPPENQMWTEETTSELRVAIGRTGATKFQYLAIGKGTRQHGLVAGKTGSGKSTLFHVIITNLSLWCSPEQVEFYLVDFKKGVEFKCYANQRLPHARVVAIESDREFGLSVLQRLDDELRRRGDLFRRLGVQDVAGYKKAGGTERIPRCLLLVDEFQEFFVEDDKVAQTASLLMDRIVRQGRAFGIHVLLGSQTLGGAYTVARTTLGQMVIRIALQCNEADAYLIMDENNPAPRLLSRPGEGIYNDTAGSVEGNSPFQVVWLPDEVRDTYLEKVRRKANNSPTFYPGPIVFEGNAPADIKENLQLSELLQADNLRAEPSPRMWLGAPNSIKGPTEAVFHRQSGNNLFIVGQREEATLAIFTVGLISLAAQLPLGGARFILCDSAQAGTPERDYLERVVRAMAHPVTLARQSDLPEIMGELSNELKKRNEEGDTSHSPPIFLFIHDLQRFNKLRYEEDFSFSSTEGETAANPAAVLNTLVCEGTRLGIHVIANCDSYNNVNRFLSRKAFSEFEMRVLFQMSANDSASLIDNPKASNLGLHRALYFNAQEGYLETFRPYALPTTEWLDQVAEQLLRRLNRAS